MALSNIEKIREVYEHLWDTSKTALAQGLNEPDTIPAEGGRRWGVSVIVRPTEPVLSRLGTVAKEVSRFIGSEHVIYDVSNLHTTLRTLEMYRSDVTSDDKLIQQYINVIQKVADQFKTIRILYRGLTANKTSIMAQGWPLDNTFQAMRNELQKQLDSYGLLTGPEVDNNRQIAHASLIVFSTSILSPNALVNYVAANRKTDYGSTEITKIEIVKYEKSDTSVHIFVLGEIELNNS